jgi:drug/metabolite transporter (DMT)-like permease
MRNFFWPTTRDPAPTGFKRFGRVVHWIGTGLAAAIVVFGVVATSDHWQNTGYLDDVWKGLAATFVCAALFSLAGRALRYIFSGE